MLGEAFIRTFRYRQDNSQNLKTPGSYKRPACPEPQIKGTHELMEGNAGEPVQSDPVMMSPTSEALAIPNSHSDQNDILDLYRSWHCTSFCKDYPDVQLRGDRVGDKSLHSPPLEDYTSQGPRLQPLDLDVLPLGPVKPGLRVETQPLQDDDGYLVMDSSITLPLSNSMLNGYLESKLLEVYRQHMQDSLSRCRSPMVQTPPPGLLPPAVQHLSQQLCQDHGLDSATAHSVAMNYLSTCSLTCSHFSSPELRISQP